MAIAIGLMGGFGQPFPTAEVLEALGSEAERLGFESIWASEHAVWFDEQRDPYPYSADGRLPIHPGLPEPLVTLTFLAACTTTVRLATGVLILPQRNPVYTAQQIASLDLLSNGRTIVGVGLGWQKTEYEALNVPLAGRSRRFVEYVEVMKKLWCDDTASFSGDYYDLPPCTLLPKPVRKPHPPIVVGGNSDAALERVAAHAQGWYALSLSPEALDERLALLASLLDRHGRSRADIEVTLAVPRAPDLPDAVQTYSALGIDRLLVKHDTSSVAAVTESLERIASETIGPVPA